MIGAGETIQVVAAILWRNGRCLAVSRPEGFRYAGFWEFPGGKIEPGESPEEALARELEEELGVEVREWEPWLIKRHEYPEYIVVLHFYHVRAFAGEPEPREGQQLRWIDPALGPEGCPDITFLPADVDVVRNLARLATGHESE